MPLSRTADGMSMKGFKKFLDFGLGFKTLGWDCSSRYLVFVSSKVLSIVNPALMLDISFAEVVLCLHFVQKQPERFENRRIKNLKVLGV